MNVGDRVSYSESVKINIGDYEDRQFGLSITSDAMGRRFGTISEKASKKIKDETLDEATERVIKKVRKRLKKREIQIRKASAKDVAFNTMDKV